MPPPQKKHTQGQYQVKPPLPFIPGNEVSGVVVQVAPGVKGFRPGDLVRGAGMVYGLFEATPASV